MNFPALPPAPPGAPVYCSSPLLNPTYKVQYCGQPATFRSTSTAACGSAPRSPTRRTRVRHERVPRRTRPPVPDRRRAPARRPEADSLATWFLGPKAENADVLTRLAATALKAHAADRLAYEPNDPLWVTDEIKKTPAYRAGVQQLETSLNDLLERLHGSVPFFSYRYQAHMLWDVTVPAVLGYLAATLYNQNNVAAEASR